MPSDSSLPQSLLDRLPHRPPLRLLDRVLSSEAGASLCVTQMDSHKAALFGDGRGGVHACIGIELIAQAAALGFARDAANAQPRGGRLVMVKSFVCERTSFALGAEARVEAEVAAPELGSPFAIASGRVSQDGELVCQATVLLALESQS